jgi:hypothetical protein
MPSFPPLPSSSSSTLIYLLCQFFLSLCHFLIKTCSFLPLSNAHFHSAFLSPFPCFTFFFKCLFMIQPNNTPFASFSLSLFYFFLMFIYNSVQQHILRYHLFLFNYDRSCSRTTKNGCNLLGQHVEQQSKWSLCTLYPPSH